MKSIRQTERDARALWRLCQADGALDEARARRVVDLVIASRRRGTSAVLGRFLRLLRLDRHRHTACVESATALDERTRAAMVAGLARRYGPALATTFRIDPRLVCGTRVTVGNDVYDNSVTGRLAALEARF